MAYVEPEEVAALIEEEVVVEGTQLRFDMFEPGYIFNSIRIIISIFGSMILNSFLVNLVVAGADLNDSKMSNRRYKSVMLDFQRTEVGLLRDYSANLIQAFHRIKKYQQLCAFIDVEGAVRPSVKNMAAYRMNRRNFNHQIQVFQYYQFKIRTHKMRCSGDNKANPEYYWGR